MTNPRIKIKHIEPDFNIGSLHDAAWKSGETVRINKYWNAGQAETGRDLGAVLLWSDAALYVRFDANQDEPLVASDDPRTSEKTLKLWERDVCELFIAPDTRNRRRYFEFEVAPTGEWLDLIVDWTKDEPRDWEFVSGMETSALIEANHVTMAMKIPWTAFGKKPEAEDIWLGNLFRQVGLGDTRGYLAWSPTMTPKPQFHVPEKFGEFEFVK